MKKYNSTALTAGKVKKLYLRPSIDIAKSMNAVAPIIQKIKKDGKKGAIEYAKVFDGFSGRNIIVSKEEMRSAGKNLSAELKSSIKQAYKNIYSYHKEQLPKSYSVETMPGVVCKRDYRPIENIGLYVPGGSAVLFSTLLMLAIPAQIAGCSRIVVCSPSYNNKISDELLYTASLCGITEFYKIGGAQAIALMAYGDKTIPKVDKIFGPGNQYVTAAKTLVSIDPEGCAIDMPAGPSEVLVIADKFANPEYVAADLLSQAEHGSDSQALLVTTSTKLAIEVEIELPRQIALLERKVEMASALKKSFILIVPSINDAFEFSNNYAPEHLILNIKNAAGSLKLVKNAGSVFIGPYSPESAGDYASGTNHSLPTYGYAKAYSGVSVEQFMKCISFQTLTLKGLKGIGTTIINMAEAEKLSAHATAVKVRLK